MPNKSIIIACFVALFLIIGQGNLCVAQAKIYQIDTTTSNIAFEVTHLGILKVKGHFPDFTGTFAIADEKLSQIESRIKVKSIDTGDKTRDRSLVDEAYLNAKVYPVIHFKSISVVDYEITGLLTIKEVQKTIKIPFQLLKMTDFHQIIMSTTVSRKDFELDFGAMDSLVGDKIQIELKIVNRSD